MVVAHIMVKVKVCSIGESKGNNIALLPNSIRKNAMESFSGNNKEVSGWRLLETVQLQIVTDFIWVTGSGLPLVPVVGGLFPYFFFSRNHAPRATIW